MRCRLCKPPRPLTRTATMRSLLLLAAACGAHTARVAKPNIVFFLTDDQDQMLGGSFPPLQEGVTPMPFTEKEFAKKGMMATNMFIHTPICCPSRSEMLTGRYFHNVKRKGAEHGNCPSGVYSTTCCMHVDERLVNNQTWGKALHARGYTTGYFGKYLNVSPKFDKKPAGWDSFMGNGGGTYFASPFDVSNVTGFPDGPLKTDKDTYNTAFVANVTMNWIQEKVEQKEEPFMAVFGFKAAHEPFTPAPWYADYWAPEWPEHEPRPVSWNCSAESRADHHESIATNPDIITDGAADFITKAYKDRWRTLMSVDDAIKATFALCDDLGITDHTYFFYSSDHGFQLGQFNILIDKRHVYDHNTRIHLLVKGPGIKPGSTFDALATQVDLAPTFLALGGADPTTTQGDLPVDGKSLLPFLFADESLHEDLPASVEASLKAIKGDSTSLARARADWRDSVFIEYYFNDDNVKYQPYHGKQYKTEDTSNSFIAVRHVNSTEFGNTLYSEFQTDAHGEPLFDKVDFVEYYNIDADPWQMDNIHDTADKATMQKLHDKLRMWYTCSGASCP